MIKAIDSGIEYAAGDKINRTAMLIANGCICQQGYKASDKTVAFTMSNKQKTRYTNSFVNVNKQFC